MIKTNYGILLKKIDKGKKKKKKKNDKGVRSMKT